MSNSSGKILIYDLETAHNIAAIFQLRDEYTPHTNLLQERYIISAAYKWLGEKKIHTISVLDDAKRFDKDPNDDGYVVEELAKVMAEADAVVAHNGDQFDNKYVRTRMLFHGLKPLPPITSIDTYKVAKSQFNFNSNRLDYIAQYLKVGKKKSTPPGLWLEALQGSKKAIKIMLDYNKHDVKILEGVFKKLIPYMPNYISRELFGGTGCPRCGSQKYQKRGTHKAITNTYQRFQCNGCGGWFRELKAQTKSTKHRVI